MKAVIMAGGEGSRLRPLTLNLPKPLTRLCGTAVLEYLFSLLARHGFDECTLSTGYLRERIAAYMDQRPDGILPRAMLVEEAVPLGTAGGVKNATNPQDTEVLVISGDALCDVDLSEAMARHRQSGAAATIVVRRVDDPRAYGLVLTTPQGFVQGFVEKPPLSQATTNLANTGIYLLSREALDMIPSTRRYDFAEDLFPRMLAAHCPIAVYETDGYWCDIGDLDSYTRCQYDLLQGKVCLDIPGVCRLGEDVWGAEKPVGDYVLSGPVYMGHHVVIGQGARITGPCVLDDGAVVGAGAILDGGVYLEGAFLGEGVQACQALVCARASVKSGAHLQEGCAIGSGAVVGSFAQIEPGIKVWQNRHVPDKLVLSTHLVHRGRPDSVFDDDGIVGEVGVELTPELFCRLGCAVGSVEPKTYVAVACCEGRSAKALKAAMIAGIQSSGAYVMDFGAVYQSLFHFCLTYTGGGLGVYISCSPKQNRVQLAGPGALGCDRVTERKIEAALSSGEFLRADAAHYGECIDMEGMQVLYASELLRHAPYGLTGGAARVHCHNRAVEGLLRDTLQGLGCDTATGDELRLSDDGMELSILGREGRLYPHHRLLCLLALTELMAGRDVALPYGAPRMIDALAQKHDRQVLRYYACPVGETDSRARALASSQPYFRDALMMAVRLLSFQKVTGMTLEELDAHLPPFTVFEGELDGIATPAALMESMRQDTQSTDGEGILLTHALGLALVRPSKRGDRIRVFAESRDAEAAQELCGDILSRLKNARGEAQMKWDLEQHTTKEMLDIHKKER